MEPVTLLLLLRSAASCEEKYSSELKLHAKISGLFHLYFITNRSLFKIIFLHRILLETVVYNNTFFIEYLECVFYTTP